MIRKLVVVFILVFCSVIIYGQKKSIKTYVSANRLYDYGYGLEHYDFPLVSVFDYSCFIDSCIYFKEIQSINCIDSINKKIDIVLSTKKGFINKITLVNDKTVVHKYINNKLMDFNRIDKIYNVYCYEKSYILLYLSDDFSLKDKRGTYLGLLINLKSNVISVFPKLQNSNSILCLADIDGDKSVDYISFLPGEGGLVEIYKFNQGKFIINKKYSSVLKNSDGYVWAVNPDGGDFISNQYLKGLCRR